MSEMDKKNSPKYSRWYDSKTELTELLELIKTLPSELQEEILTSILKSARVIREKLNHPNNDEAPISIGKHKVLGLYKSSQKRRWYDESAVLTNAFNVLSTLPEKDCSDIVQGIVLTLKEMGFSS